MLYETRCPPYVDLGVSQYMTLHDSLCMMLQVCVCMYYDATSVCVCVCAIHWTLWTYTSYMYMYYYMYICIPTYLRLLLCIMDMHTNSMDPLQLISFYKKNRILKTPVKQLGQIYEDMCMP